MPAPTPLHNRKSCLSLPGFSGNLTIPTFLPHYWLPAPASNRAKSRLTVVRVHLDRPLGIFFYLLCSLSYLHSKRAPGMLIVTHSTFSFNEKLLQVRHSFRKTLEWSSATHFQCEEFRRIRKE